MNRIHLVGMISLWLVAVTATAADAGAGRAKAEMACQTCHGDHGKNDKLPIYKKNRLTGYSIDIWGRNIAGYKRNTWDRMKMDDCADCHTEEGKAENNACFVCHK